MRLLYQQYLANAPCNCARSATIDNVTTSNITLRDFESHRGDRSSTAYTISKDYVRRRHRVEVILRYHHILIEAAESVRRAVVKTIHAVETASDTSIVRNSEVADGTKIQPREGINITRIVHALLIGSTGLSMTVH